MRRLREACRRALPAALGYAAGALAVELLAVCAEAWLARRADRAEEDQAVRDGQAEET